MAEIRSMSSIREKWTRVTPGRQEDYKLGVQNARRDWATETANAKDNWQQGVTKAASQGLFEKGVEEAGTSKWKDNALTKGPGRFAEGVYAAGSDYEKGFRPYHDAIASVDLGPRYPRRDPRNLERVKKVVDAMIAVKTG